MELANILKQDLNINNNSLDIKQNSFLETNLWKVINSGLNIGIRALLPDLIENEVISIKDAIIKNGFKSGVKQAINSSINLGKSAIGIVTGNFENITQAQNAIKNGGILDSISSVLNYSIDKAVKKDILPKEVGTKIKQGKNVIINTIESNIENSFNNQQSSLEKISKYSENWKNYYKEQDFKNMDKEYKKIKENMKELLPIEKTIKQVREIENIHLLIKNNGQDFNLSKEQLELAKILTN